MASRDDDTKDDPLDPPQRGTAAAYRALTLVHTQCELLRTAMKVSDTVVADQAAREATYRWLVGVAVIHRLEAREARGNRDPWLDSARRAVVGASQVLGRLLRTSARRLKAPENRAMMRQLRLTLALVRALQQIDNDDTPEREPEHARLNGAEAGEAVARCLMQMMNICDELGAAIRGGDVDGVWALASRAVETWLAGLGALHRLELGADPARLRAARSAIRSYRRALGDLLERGQAQLDSLPLRRRLDDLLTTLTLATDA